MSVLLLHPVGLDRRSFDACGIPDSLAVDLPGFGRSRTPVPSSLAGVADAVLDEADAADAPDSGWDVVGVSLGGMVALHLALRHPHRVRSLVVAAAPAAGPSEVMRGRAIDTREGGMPGIADETLSRWFTSAFLSQGGAAVQWTRARLLSDSAAVVADYWELIAEHDVRARLGEIEAPVTAVAGGRDRSTPAAVVRELADGIAGARYVELDAPHMLHLEAPRAFAEAVAEHLALVPASAATVAAGTADGAAIS